MKPKIYVWGFLRGTVGTSLLTPLLILFLSNKSSQSKLVDDSSSKTSPDPTIPEKKKTDKKKSSKKESSETAPLIQEQTEKNLKKDHVVFDLMIK